MWQEIRLRSLGVIEDATLDLGPGLSVITGETGAGKTMVVTALGLLQGGRSDAALVRHGDEHARVEARVDVSENAQAHAVLEDTAAELEDDAVILGRTISREGRSRAFLGGSSVTAGVLGRLSRHLVAVHGQSDQQRLLQVSAQRAALDAYGGKKLAGVRERYERAYETLRLDERHLETLTTSARERARELDMLTFGIEEIAAVEPRSGEDEELQAREDRLAHAEALATAAHTAREALASDDLDGGDAFARVAQAQGALAGVREHDPELDALAVRLDEISHLLSELGTDLGSYGESIELDPEELAATQERRSTLAGLIRKYGPGLAGVLEWADAAAERARLLEGDDQEVDGLTARIETQRTELLTQAAQLHTLRVAAAKKLAKQVTAELGELAMPHARLGVEVVAPDEPVASDLGPHGYDQVDFMLAANAGAPALPLAKGASGGELSRVMLALEVVLADRTAVPTFVFDEVDAGIGGRAAVEVGRRLARLARHSQVLAVTHLPQVAAFADRHYRVEKSDDGSVTTSGVRMLDDAERVAELSRMLAGLDGSRSAEAHARELLQVASRDRG